ncbi:MAG TPA: FAD:protein FMN transferase [Thermoanaerobaculia bacterium]|nr:FAD:protein FMN transferase [Thermoanaerobaculia bacterium]
MRLSLGLASLTLLALAAPPGGEIAEARVVRERYLMGTVLEIDALGRERAAIEETVAEAFRAVEDVEGRLSNWRRESELSRANRAAGREAVRLSPATFRSLRAALDLAEETGGAFDPTVGAVTQALGLTGEPAHGERARALAPTVGWFNIVLEPSARTLFFRMPGAAIDSGAFGKGEALDAAAAALRRGGALAARLNFGGQILLIGSGTPSGRRRGFPEVTVAAPENPGAILCRFVARDGSVSTSGDSEKPGHLIDPRTGQAAAFHGSVTVLADTGLRADALSTALFIKGAREGLLFADRRGIPALFVVRGGKTLSIVSSRVFPALSCSAAAERSR